MNATHHPLYTPAPVAAWRAVNSSLRVLARRLGRQARAWQQRRQARATLRMLSTLDDHLLRDLGIARDSLPPSPRDFFGLVLLKSTGGR